MTSRPLPSSNPVLALLTSLALFGTSAFALSADELFFSEYVEGSGLSKALEIFNGTPGAVDLSAGAYDVQIFLNGSVTASATIALTGSILPGDVFVVALSGADSVVLAQADLITASLNFTGDDALVLRKNAVVIDSIGQVGFDPGTAWGVGPTSTADNTLRRKSTVIAGDTNTGDAFDPATEWDGYGTDSFGGLGFHGGITPEALTIARTSPDTVVLKWPGNTGVNWLLETTTDLSAVDWTQVQAPYQTEGNTVFFNDSPLVGRRFYRLYDPAQSPKVLFFSEYVEGTGLNKALEIFNSGANAVDLAAGAYDVQIFANGSVTATATIDLTGTIEPGGVFVVALTDADPAVLAQADLITSSLNFNGDDALVLRKNTFIIDSIGQVGNDPGSEWGIGLTSTADNTLRRKSTITAGDANISNVFDPATEWDGYATDTFSGLGAHSLAP